MPPFSASIRAPPTFSAAFPSKLDSWASGGSTAFPSASTLPEASWSFLWMMRPSEAANPTDRVDREGPRHDVLLTNLGHQRLRLAGVPVLDRVVGDEQPVVHLGGGRVAHEEVGLVAGTAAALRALLGRGQLANLPGGAPFFASLLLVLLRLGRESVVALPLLRRALRKVGEGKRGPVHPCPGTGSCACASRRSTSRRSGTSPAPSAR